MRFRQWPASVAASVNDWMAASSKSQLRQHPARDALLRPPDVAGVSFDATE